MLEPSEQKLKLRLLFQGLHSFLNQEMIKDLDELYDMTDKYTDRWLSSGIWFHNNAASSFCYLCLFW